MKKATFLILPFAALMALASCGEKAPYVEPDMSRDDSKVASTLYVNKIENIPEGFIMGMDASSVIAEEASGVKYYDFDGKEADVFETLSKAGINTIRVRIWNDPYDSNGKGYGGGNNDLAKAIEIGKRATKYKMRLLVDFHYSDFWADPAKQQAPKAWVGMNIEEKQEALYKFTKESLQALQDNNIAVGMVQIGNETNGGHMAGETRFTYFSALVNQGSKAVREVYPKALVAVHFANPEKTGNYADYAKKLDENHVDYDVFGSSYYPYWHGTLDNLSTVLDGIAKTYSKKVMVLETSYAYTTENTDFWGNTIGESGYDTKAYPFTIAGQANNVWNITNTVVNKMSNGIGICYWEGTWISVGTDSYDANKLLWEKYGSGWASSYAKSYDPEDAGKFYGGCAVENQAMFDETGHPLESLKVFNLMRHGNITEKYIDGIEDANLSKYTYEEFTLPSTVNVIYNDNSREAIPVKWDDFDIEAAKAKGNGKYDIQGTAGGKEVHCYLTILEKNFLENFGFETGSLGPWKLTFNNDIPQSNSYVVKVTKENPQTGEYNMNFWANDPDTLDFNIEQDVEGLEPGVYKFQASLMGGGANNSPAEPDKQDIYIYAKLNGVEVARKDAEISSYNVWKDFLIENLQIKAGDKLTVGVHVASTQAGVWGSIDDCMVNYVRAL